MKCFNKLKPLMLVLSIIALISGCGINNNATEITQISHASLSTQAEALGEKSESILFKGITEYKLEDPKSYKNKEFDFSVDYPSTFEVALADAPSSHPDGSIDSGIIIYVGNNESNVADENDHIYVYHNLAGIGIRQDYTEEEIFKTDEGVEGKIYYLIYEGHLDICLTLGEDTYYGANINMSEASFEKYKEQIYGVLKSIKIPEEFS